MAPFPKPFVHHHPHRQDQCAIRDYVRVNALQSLKEVQVGDDHADIKVLREIRYGHRYISITEH